MFCLIFYLLKPIIFIRFTGLQIQNLLLKLSEYPHSSYILLQLKKKRQLEFDFMQKQLTSSPNIIQSSSKLIFSTNNQQQQMNCKICQLFDHRKSFTLEIQRLLTNQSLIKQKVKKSLKGIKMCKKSSKENLRVKNNQNNILFSLIVYDRSSQKVNNSTNFNSEMMMSQDVLKKTDYSDKNCIQSQSPVFFSQQEKNQKQTAFSIGNVNSKSTEQQSANIPPIINQVYNFQNVPMTQSINGENLSSIKQQKQIKNQLVLNKIDKNVRLQLLKFKSPSQQKLLSMEIFPLKEPIKEENSRFHFVTKNTIQFDRKNINKLLQHQNQNDFREECSFKNNNEKQKQKESPKNIISSNNLAKPFPEIQITPIALIVDKNISSKSISIKDYLEMSFDKISQNQQNDKEKDNNFLSKNQFQVKFNGLNVNNSEVGKNMQEPKNTEINQNKEIVIQEIVKYSLNNTNGSGRFSEQVPKSKKFKSLKVRKTISMKDQQQSSQQEASEVVYGFRKFNNPVVIEDVAEYMQQSCMTKREINRDD